MIFLDFEVNPDSLARAKGLDLHTCSSAMLTETLLIMPVSVLVDEKRVINAEAPILYVAISLSYVEGLSPGSAVVIDPPGLQLIRNGDSVIMRSIRSGDRVQVSYDELRSAWSSFAKGVRDFLGKELPELIDHPEVGEWFGPST